MGLLTAAYNRYPETVGNLVARVLHPFEVERRVSQKMAADGWKIIGSYDPDDPILSKTDHFKIAQELSFADDAQKLDADGISATIYSHPEFGVVSTHSDEYICSRYEAAAEARKEVAAEYFASKPAAPAAP